MKLVQGFVVGAIVAGAAGPAAAQNLEIFTSNPGAVALCCVGGASTSNTVAQTFVVPQADFNVLTSFSLWTSGASNADAVFRASIYSWDAGPIGAALYQSDDRAVTSGTVDNALRRHDFFVGALALVPGSIYAMVMSGVSGGTAHLVHLIDNPYADGSMLVRGGGVAWTDTPWDLQASAAFSSGVVTPEPVSLLLMGTGLAGLLGVRRRYGLKTEKA